MNDRQRFAFAGHPTRCIRCGAVMRVRTYKKMTEVICPDYGKECRGDMSFAGPGDYTGSGVGHEWYRWQETDPDLPPFLSWGVGDVGPTGRAAIYATVIFAAVVVLMAALMLLAAPW